jgi:hypothetical protein
MFNVATKEPFIALLAKTIVRCAWGSNHWPQLTYFFPLHLHRKSPPMLKTRLIKKLNSLNVSITSNNKFMISCIKLMESINNATINIRFHTSFKWEIRYNCIYGKRTSQDPIGISTHFYLGLTLSPRLQVKIILS